jgi:hypothetical protein
MHHQRTIRARASFLVMGSALLLTALPALAALAGCSGAETATSPPVGNAEGEFSTTLSGEPVHEDVTAEGLAFLRPEIILAVQAANVSVDTEFALVSASHFDDCNFSGGAGVIRHYQQAAVAALGPDSVAGAGVALAILAFGQWLHTTQDFYAHTNWVELGGQALADDGLAMWADWSPYDPLASSGFRLVEGSPPRQTSVTRKADAPYPENAVVRVKRAKAQSPGVISGSVDYEPGDSCPPSVRMTHADLNKDHSATPGRTAQFVAAKALAVEQTHHEWCRLVAMTRTAWGDAGEARLAAWLADPTATPCP